MAYWPDTGTGVDTQPARKPVQSPLRKYFTEGGIGQAPTVPGGDWFNQMTNEVLNVLEAAGIEPSKTDDNQLIMAIELIVSNESQALRNELSSNNGASIVGAKSGENVQHEIDVSQSLISSIYNGYNIKTSLHGCGKSLGAENSLITYTILSGLTDIVDVDISTTLDDVPILLHNINVDGITSGTGSIFTLTAAQIASQRVLAFDGTPFAGTSLTTLEQFLESASRHGSMVSAELKNTTTSSLSNILSIITNSNMIGRIKLQCLNVSRLIEWRAIDSIVPIEILVYDGMPTPSLEEAISSAISLGNCGISVDVSYSRIADAISQAKSAFIPVSAFTATTIASEMSARKVIGRTQLTRDFVGE